MEIGKAPAEGASVWHADRPARRATGSVVGVVGLVAALAGVEQGIGELLQPGADTRSPPIPSWLDGPGFAPLGGSPGITLIPDLRVAGGLTVLVSLTIGWRAVRVQARAVDGWALLALSALLLVTGGGYGPPLVTAILGLAVLTAAATDVPFHRLGPLGAALAGAWRPLLALTVTAFLVLFAGVVLLRGIAGVEIVWLAAILPFFAFLWLVLTLVAAGAADRTAGSPTRQT